MTDKNNNKYYLHYDQVGSLRAVTDSNGNLVKEITYDSYGNIISDTNPNFKVPFGFAGGLYDEDTKLVHFGYREYDPQIGRWLSKDPLLFSGSNSNLYTYILNNPINLIDPWGLWDPNLFPDPNVVPGGPWEPALKDKPGLFLGPKIPGKGRPQLQYVPDQANGGTYGAKNPYWKVNYPGQKGWQRYNLCGEPITPEEAHPKPDSKAPELPFFFRPKKAPISPWLLLFYPTPLG